MKQLIVVFAVFLAACGGGGGASGDGSAPPASNSPPAAPAPAPQPNTPPGVSVPEPTDVAFYKSGIEKALGILLLVEKAAQSDVKRIPEWIADQVTAHGPTPEDCEVCRDYWFPAILPNGKEITVVHFWDANGNNKYDFDVEALPYLVTDVYGVTGSVFTLTRVNEGKKRWIAGLGARYDNALYPTAGAQIAPSKLMQLLGSLEVRELGGDRLRIGPDQLLPSFERELFVPVMNERGERDELLELRLTMDTNVSDSDAVDARFDWRPYGASAIEAFETIDTLDFGTLSGQVVLEDGRFLYMKTTEDGESFAVRVSVSDDPTHLLLEMDVGADGVYEATGYLSQAEMNFVLP